MSIKVDFAKEEDFEDIVEFDRQLYGDEWVIEVDELLKWHSKNPYQVLVAKDENDTLLGNIGLYHLKDETLDMLIAGKLEEHDITKDYLLGFKESPEINLHLTIEVIDKNIRAGAALLRKVVWYFNFLKQNNIKVKKMSAIGYTKAGIELCNRLGFKPVREYEVEDNVIPILFIKQINDNSTTRLVKIVKGIFLEKNEAI